MKGPLCMHMDQRAAFCCGCSASFVLRRRKAGVHLCTAGPFVHGGRSVRWRPSSSRPVLDCGPMARSGSSKIRDATAGGHLRGVKRAAPRLLNKSVWRLPRACRSPLRSMMRHCDGALTCLWCTRGVTTASPRRHHSDNVYGRGRRRKPIWPASPPALGHRARSCHRRPAPGDTR